jgi:ribosomal protein S18 acetylase RimI-like enzyme
MVVPLSLPRPATLQDARALAELVNLAGAELQFSLWAKMAKDGEDPWSVGTARARREHGSFSYRNATIIEVDRNVAACLVSYPLPEEPAAIDEANMPATFVPLQQLENLAPGTWHVNVLASYPQWQKNGFGTALLNHAENLAVIAGIKKGMSVIVADSNAPARRLYERMGYSYVANRPMVKENWQGPGSSWVLLAKDACVWDGCSLRVKS